MASNFLGINRGKTENPGNITGTTTQGSSDIELRMDTGKNLTREDVIKALRIFELYLLSGLPPIAASGTVGQFIPPK